MIPWRHDGITRARRCERRDEQQLHAAGTVVEIRRPDGADRRFHDALRHAPEEVDIAGRRVAREVVEIGIHPEAVVVAACGHVDRVRPEFDWRGASAHVHVLPLLADSSRQAPPRKLADSKTLSRHSRLELHFKVKDLH